MLFTDVCAGFICCCYGGCWGWCILGTLGALWGLVHMGGAACFSHHVYQTRVTEVWTRSLGGGWRGHSLRDPRGVHWIAQKCPVDVVPYVLAFEGQPCPLGYDACMVFLVEGHSGEIAGKIKSRNSSFR